MGMKKYKPTSAGRRTLVSSDFEGITTSKPHKKLTSSKYAKPGRNNQGRLTVKNRGGGVKKAYRLIDFKRNKDDVPGIIATIEYDPNRSCRIALVHYRDGDKRYIIAPVGLKVGHSIMSGNGVEVKVGNAMPLKNIPAGTIIHNIELVPGKGGQMARSAGAAVQLMAKEEDFAVLKLVSGEQRRVRVECRATIGQVGNIEQRNIQLGKAGRNRWKGVKPHVRGSVMNPCDHPHGGGEGRAPVGRSHPSTPGGKPALGLKTRKKNKASDKLIISRRKR